MAIFPLDEKEIHYRVSHARVLPLLPRALERLWEIIQREVVSPEEVRSLIQYDPLLTATILRIANSTYFGSRGKVLTASQAMQTVGFDQVRSTCLRTLVTALLSEDLTLEASQREKSWKHSYATAKMAVEIARKRPWIDKEEAFTLGLLHDLGRMVMALHFSDHHKWIQNVAEEEKLPLWYVESQCGFTHAYLGKCVAVKWGFPEVLQRTMEFHHTPEKSPAFKPEVKMIHLANMLAHSARHPDSVRKEWVMYHYVGLYITEEEWNGYLERLNEICIEVDQLWTLLK